MPRDRVPVAVCLIRVEPELERAVITVTVNPDIAVSASQLVRRFTDSESAVAAVTEFLDSATRNTLPLAVSGARLVPLYW